MLSALPANPSRHAAERETVNVKAIAITAITVAAMAATAGIYIKAWDYRRYYEEAEPVGDLVSTIWRDLPDDARTPEGIAHLIAGPKYMQLQQRGIRYVDDTNAFFWIDVNARFTIGLARDGRTLWDVHR